MRVCALLDTSDGDAAASMDQADRSVDCRKVEMRAFDHPWSELDDLFRRESLSAQPACGSTASLTSSATAACCMVIQRRWSGGGQAGKPLVWRTCCTRFSVQVLPVPVR